MDICLPGGYRYDRNGGIMPCEYMTAYKDAGKSGVHFLHCVFFWCFFCLFFPYLPKGTIR